jgi:hypothetical protein
MTIAADITRAKIQLTDEYDFAGTDSANTISLQLDFKASYLDQVGVTYQASAGQLPSSIAISYSNSLTGDVGTLNYSYTSIL